ncbi:MAG: repressor LexA [Nitrospirae bacterium]|nr:repressor LexA [Nitrospirota bacterium]
MNNLTDRQQEILDFLKAYALRHGYPPTFREIGEHFEFGWAASRAHLKAIERKGFLRIIPSKSRGIDLPDRQNAPQGRMIPVAGRIRAGQPILAFEDIESHIFVDSTLFPAEDAFSLMVVGDSMIDAGIYNGDYVVVKPQQVIKNGEIGIVLIGDEATVKRVYISKGQVTLQPENSTMQPVTYRINEISIIGKVLGVIRKM